MREIYDKFMDVLRDIDINSLTYDEMEKVAHICSAVMVLKYNPYECIANIAKIKTEDSVYAILQYRTERKSVSLPPK